MLNRVVTHPKYGRGIVQKTRYGGATLYVKFDGKIELFRVQIDEVDFTTSLSQRATPIYTYKEERLKSRRMIEAFRYGIVPEDCLETFTFGREEEIQQLTQWLNDPKESGQLLIGSYGSGKTHLLNCFSSVALAEGFAVATVQVNHQESPFSRPKRIYSQLVQNLRVRTPKGEWGNLKWLLQKAFLTDMLDEHYYFKYVKDHQNFESVWQWIEAREDYPRPKDNNNEFKHFPGLYGNNGKPANIYCNLLSSIGWVTQLLGFKGLLLIFDESEALHANQTQISCERSYNLVEALLATARGDRYLLQQPSQSEFDYSFHAKNVPFLYKIPSGLKVLLAFTDNEPFASYEGLRQLSRLFLEPLQLNIFNRIFDRICSLYSDVYEISAEELRVAEIRDFLTSRGGSTREIVKRYVEALDLMRFYPDADIYKVLQ